MAIDKLIKILTPFSEKYGTGNSHVDLLIVFAILSLASMLFVVMILSSSKPRPIGITARKVDPISGEASSSASELKLYVDDLSREIHVMLDSLRSDTGFIRQEMYLVKRLLEDTKRAHRKSQLRNGSSDFSSFSIDNQPIVSNASLYSYKDVI